MANNWNLGVVAHLDGTKSKNQLNQDIQALKRVLDNVELKAKLDPNQVKNLENQLNKLQVSLTDVTIPQSTLNGLVTQINNALQGIQIPNINFNPSGVGNAGRQIGEIISKEAANAIGDVTSKVIGQGFTVSPKMSQKVQSELENIVKDWTNGKGKISSITIDTKTDFNEQTLENIEHLKSATVQYSNELGQVITKTLKYKQIGVNTFANGETEAIKGWVESASTYKATLESTTKSTNNFVNQQKKAVTDLTNQVNQIYKSAIDTNASKPIKNSGNLSNLENQYNDIITAIGKMGSASEATFTDERNSVNTLISDLKIVVREYKNAETAATSMRSKDVGTVKAIKTNELDEFIAKIQNSKVPMKEMKSEIASLKTSLSNITDTDSLTAYLNQFDIASSKFKSLKEQFSKGSTVSSVIFNTSELEAQGKVYIQKVRNTIEAIKPELESKLRSAGYTDIEIKGVEKANGQIKSLAATVTDATGAFKQLNFQREKIQGKGKAQFGFVQTDDVKVIGTLSSSVEKVQGNLTTLKSKWEEQGVLVGDFKIKVEQLETSLTSVGSKGELNGLKSQIETLKTQASQIADVNKIQLQLDTEQYSKDIKTVKDSLAKVGKYTLSDKSNKDIFAKAKDSATALESTYKQLKTTMADSNATDQQKIDIENKYQQELTTTKNLLSQIKLSKDDELVSVGDSKRVNMIATLNSYLAKNTAMTKENKKKIEEWIATLGSSDDITVGAIKNINSEFKRLDSTLRSTGQLGLSTWDKFKQAVEKFGGWSLVTGAITTAIQVGKEMVNEVYEIDTAMTNLYKVTDETSDRYDKFLDNACDKAKELGRTVSSLVEQTANWSKLGYSLDDAEQLAEISSIYANVGEVDDDTAVSDMVTAMKAYGIATKDAITIVDSLNVLGNKYATSAADLGAGLSKSASAMATAGTDMDKTLAMLTGGAEITQSAEEFGNMLKVASMRIRGMKGELEALGEEVDENVESISKIQTQILNLTHGKVNIFDNNNEFRDYYDIMEDISEVYNSLSSTEQASLSEILFGKQRGNQGAALIQAFQSGQIQNAYEDIQKSAGSAYEEQARLMESLEADFCLVA